MKRGSLAHMFALRLLVEGRLHTCSPCACWLCTLFSLSLSLSFPWGGGSSLQADAFDCRRCPSLREVSEAPFGL